MRGLVAVLCEGSCIFWELLFDGKADSCDVGGSLES
jgi:hypothetical protein